MAWPVKKGEAGGQNLFRGFDQNYWSNSNVSVDEMSDENRNVEE